ncbi:MAG: thioredoxin domain-containing protein [Acidobacteriota bacterium]|nr:thioredoxin domain-containing protein [Acidobacteriota bacterium]
MKYLIALITAALLSASISSAVAQVPSKRLPGRRRPAEAKAAVPEVAADPKPEPAATVASTIVPVDSTIPSSLAILNGQTVTVSDLNPTVSQEIAQLGARVGQVRSQILEVQINTALLDLEAKKRKLTPQQVYEAEVAKRITEPTEAEIAKLLNDNRASLGDSDPKTLHADAIAYLKSQQEQRLSAELIRKARVGTSLVPGTDINSPDLKPTSVVATVGGQPITAGSLTERLKPIIYRLRLSTYQLANRSLQQTLNDLLLLAEANRRSVPPEDLIRAEVSDKVHTPTDAEVEKFYNDNKAQIPGDLASVKNDIANFLREKQGKDLEQALAEKLRKGANLRILLTEPEPPVQIINTAGEPSRGNVNAPVTVVEYTDFQCPSCAAMYPVLEEVLPRYGTKVRLVVRNYPLARHNNARKAAEAADAANAQGKFFEYTALLFKRQDALDIASLKKYATEIGLDRTRFDSELDRGVHSADVIRDVEDAQINGVESTPTLFINGIMLMDLTPEGLTAAIDKALAKAGVR